MILKFTYYDADRQLSPHFNSKEFRCHCGCQHALIDERLVTTLELLRMTIDEPLRLTCGYRCPIHNRNVPGAAWNSRHKKGEAADVAASNPDALAKVAEALRLEGGGRAFKRIGIYPHRFFVHLGIAGLGFRTWRK